MPEAAEIKQILYDMGADLCGIAPIDRFAGAPEGFHPLDVMPSCRSVIVFAVKMPASTISCSSKVPYTVARNMIGHELDVTAVRVCRVLEQYGIAAAPIGALGPDKLDANTGRWRAAVSAKHSAVAAGLGRIGRNTLLTTPEYGNMVWLGVVLTDAELEPDEMLPGNPCKDDCKLCIDGCPAGALGGAEIDQGACRAYAFRDIEGQDWTFSCYACRSVCPNCLGGINGGPGI
jgi:epoxyqueuosine reductase QueG